MAFTKMLAPALLMEWTGHRPRGHTRQPDHRTPTVVPVRADVNTDAIAPIMNGVARHGAAEDERRRASVRWPTTARPDHRRVGALLPARRDADDSKQACELGDL